MVISDEERKSLNLKESQILTSNLSAQDSMIASHDILSEPTQLKLIGNLHESLVMCYIMALFSVSTTDFLLFSVAVDWSYFSNI